MSFNDAFIKLPDLRTNRLNIRQLQPHDAEAIFEIKSTREVTRMYGAEPSESIAQIRKWIEDRVLDYKNKTALSWVFTITGEDRAIGSVYLSNLDLDSCFAEVGYELNATYWKRGYMFEALWAILDYSFGIGFHRIEARPFEINEPSKKLLLKLGFKHEGTLRDRLIFHGEYCNQMYLGLLKHEWMKRKEHFEPHS